ncbi:hypothetical protein [Pelagimonas phthalicica]|uniref:hypothetical protein n=1 Tax=Pelagimonas phthalicica TaxID=1037362 RepID=UPI00105C0023|nr:hypothetical protein [Pelagimonas phthalicica]
MKVMAFRGLPSAAKATLYITQFCDLYFSDHSWDSPHGENSEQVGFVKILQLYLQILTSKNRTYASLMLAAEVAGASD